MLAAAQRATPQLGVDRARPTRRRAGSPTRGRCCARADVVVTHAGQNAIADVAAATASGRRDPTGATPRRTARHRRALRDAGLAVVCSRWPEPRAWPALLSEAARRGGGAAGSAGAPVRAPAAPPRCWRSWHAHHGDHDRRRPPRAPRPPARRTAVRERHVVVAMGDGEAERCRAARRRRGRRDRGRVRIRTACRWPGRATRAHGAPWTRARSCSCSSTSTAFPARRCCGATARRPPAGADALLCGPVAYLPPAPRGGYPAGRAGRARLAAPRAARPAGGRRRSAAATTRCSGRCRSRSPPRRGSGVGGFCEDYVGYGGEDTDFGQRRRVAPASTSAGWAAPGPITSITRSRARLCATSTTSSATPRIFHRRWGWWPMRGWLEAFAERGLARHDPAADRWVLATTE